MEIYLFCMARANQASLKPQKVNISPKISFKLSMLPCKILCLSKIEYINLKLIMEITQKVYGDYWKLKDVKCLSNML
jgi:hypothetical protein